MGLPFVKKKAKDTGEKKDLKQNYTTEDHKTDLGDLLRSLNSDATQVSIPRRAEGAVLLGRGRQAGIILGYYGRVVGVGCAAIFESVSTSAKSIGRVWKQPPTARSVAELLVHSYASIGVTPRPPALRCNPSRVVTLLLARERRTAHPSAGHESESICTPCRPRLPTFVSSENFCSLG